MVAEFKSADRMMILADKPPKKADRTTNLADKRVIESFFG
jgi:hypothetical protein